MSSLAGVLDTLTVEGALYERLPDDAVRCYACGHRCLIRPGRRGICQVRFNQGGRLRVPWGYVAALQADPIEKKPFFHFLPGSDALTFGMLGCDFHCGYCFTGDTVVITGRGPRTLADLFANADRRLSLEDGEVSYPTGLQAVTASGLLRSVRGVFKHPYQGKLVTLRPYYLPPLRCTPDHRVYAAANAQEPPRLVPAGQLSQHDYLAIPRRNGFSTPQTLDVAQLLQDCRVRYHVRWVLPAEKRREIELATVQGQTSRQIGAALDLDPSYVRHVRGKLRAGRGSDYQTSGPLIENGLLRFPNERHPGIPVAVALDEDLARLLGYFCAEGSIVESKQRPNSLVLNFSFSRNEIRQAVEVQTLLKRCLGVEARLVQHSTTLGVSAGKASAARLFQTLAGSHARGKRVPEQLFDAPRPVVQAFLEAYVDGDGHRFANGKVSVTTVSRMLAYGVAWLAIKLGHLASLYDTQMPEQGTVQGRLVQRAPHQYSVVWYEGGEIRRKVVTTQDYYLVPLRGIEQHDFTGDVYNMEVDEEHNYLAGFFLVSNCQNWLTSQAMRDSASDVSVNYVRRVTPDQMVEYARRSGASVIASSYNEPLITSEWALDIFKQARQAGLQCVYISNGNVTPEVLEYIRPYMVGYKIDLKTMQDKRYRQLGGVLDHVLEGIRLAHSMGLWVEVVTLVVPGFNDSSEELMDAAQFIRSISADIPWHVTAFHPDYKMTDPSPTSVRTLLRAADIGVEAGLKFVYAGNLPSHVGEYENTYCPKCHELLIKRSGYVIQDYRLTPQGSCTRCGTTLPGVWSEHPERVNLGGWGLPRPI